MQPLQVCSCAIGLNIQDVASIKLSPGLFRGDVGSEKTVRSITPPLTAQPLKMDAWKTFQTSGPTGPNFPGISSTSGGGPKLGILRMSFHYVSLLGVPIELNMQRLSGDMQLGLLWPRG